MINKMRARKRRLEIEGPNETGTPNEIERPDETGTPDEIEGPDETGTPDEIEEVQPKPKPGRKKK